MPFAFRVTEVGDDGTSVLVTKGILNATRRNGMNAPEPLAPNTPTAIQFDLEAIAWRVADIAAVVDGEVGLDVLRVDGGLTRDALLLELQADAAGVPVERGLVDATVAGAAALAAVGAGLWSSTREIAERLPRGERVEPRRDDAWRAAEHAAWRAFVERAAEL